MGADFIAVAVDVTEDQKYWLRDLADRNDTELMAFLSNDNMFWDKYFDEVVCRDDAAKTLRCDLLEAISIAYEPGREATWLHLDKKTWAVTGEHSWGDVSETYTSLLLLSEYQAFFTLEDKHRADNQTK